MSWSHVEMFMLHLYVQLAGGSQSDAAAVFMELESNSAKSAVVNVLVRRKVFEERYQELFRAITAILKQKAKARDKLAHWVWGFAPELPDALLLADPKVFATLDLRDDGIESRDHIYVYRERDFLQIIDDNERVARMGFEFRWIIQGHIANANDELYHSLCAEPEIQAILDRRASQAGSREAE